MVGNFSSLGDRIVSPIEFEMRAFGVAVSDWIIDLLITIVLTGCS